MKEVFKQFRFCTIAFSVFMLTTIVFAFVKPIDQGAVQPNLYFATCSVGLAALCVIMAHLDQGAHPANGEKPRPQ